MAKETQDTVGEVDEMPVNDSATEADERESSKIGLAMNPATADGDAADEADAESGDEPSETNFETDGDPAEAEHEVLEANDSDGAPLASAPPSLALWLSGELRPSASKSLPPAAPGSVVEHPETLAPVALPQAELSDEDLAVLPVGSRPGESRSLRRAVLAVLGVAAAVFLFTTWSSSRRSPQPHTETAAQSLPGEPVETSAPRPAPSPDVTPPSEAANEAPATSRTGHGRWVAPEADTDEALDEEARLRGPSVGRFPDLPQEYWSELRRRDLESKAERQRQLIEQSLAPGESIAP